MIQSNVATGAQKSYPVPGIRPLRIPSRRAEDSFAVSLPTLTFGQRSPFSFYFRREGMAIYPVTVNGAWLDSEQENLRLFMTDRTVLSWLPERNYGLTNTTPEYLVTIDPVKNVMTISRNSLGTRATTRPVKKPSIEENHQRLLDSYRERISITRTLIGFG